MNVNAAEILVMGNDPQKGAVVLQTFKDVNLNTTADGDAASGYVFCSLVFSDLLTTLADRCGHLPMGKYSARLRTDQHGHLSLVYSNRSLEHVIARDDEIA